MAERCAVTIVLSTFNRASLLGPAIDHLLNQPGGLPSCELIVVDNNSTDDTRALIERRQNAGDTRLRYLFEPQPGLSHARNAGIRAARADVVAFTDDDVRVAQGWAKAIRDAFDAHPDVDCLGGRTLPAWPSEPPRWLTRLHWVGPLALQDYGDAPFIVEANALCLAGANLAFRREVFGRIGLFSPEFPRSQDTELMLRFWRSGGRAMYVPGMSAHAVVQSERLTKAYHRKWHAQVGQSNARMSLEELTAANGTIRWGAPQFRRALGVPLFAVRQLLTQARGWSRESIRRHDPQAFWHELQIRALLGYMRESRALFRQRQSGGAAAQAPAGAEQAPTIDAPAGGTATAQRAR